MQDEVQYHVKLRPGDIGRYVFLPGDPGRVERIAAHLDDAKKVAQNREYTTYTGSLEGVPVSVVSTGIGGPSTAICIEEILKVGADTLIRIGTSGSLQPSIKTGDLVIASAAVRDEGTSQQYVPLEYPAVADIDVICALRDAARKLGHTHYTGVIHCKDAFFAEEPHMMPDNEHWERRWKMWQKSNVLCTEMESATLFIVSQLRKLRAGEIVAVIGETHDGQVVIEKKGVDEAIETAIEAMRSIIKQDQESEKA
ncbi:MAG: uridine phosphorylase [Deltaproteobacteria bacterium]|nr:uridine phosphorylase [Deltaproteobacteria bacterium]|tara:strand:+ start:143 stop:904 length:762 start_codon:yes stop_codon:yes gene_type:complete